VIENAAVAPLERLVAMLADPVGLSPLRLESDDSGQPILTGSGGRSYPVIRGIPRFTEVEDADQSQTRDSFGYKWNREGSYGSEGMVRSTQAWLVDRYGFDDAAGMRAYFEGREAVLDLGCGGGFSASVWMEGRWRGPCWVGVDISSAIDVAQRRLGDQPGTYFV